MNLRKFYLIISIVLAVFLSVSGIVIITNLNTAIAESMETESQDANPDELDLNGGTEPSNGSENNNGGSSNRPDIGDIEYSPLAKSKPLNILIVGGDSSSGNTDTIMIMNYNPSTTEINFLSVPRDTRVSISGTYKRINYAYPSGGSDLIKNVIWDLMDLKIDRYIFLDLSAFRDIIDILGGVEFTVPVDMKYTDKAQNLYIDLKAGKQTLNGAKAEQLIRFRKPDPDQELPDNFSDYYSGSDINRIKTQQDFFRELIRQKATFSNLPKVFKVLEVIFERVKTDFTLDELLGFVYNIDSIDIEKVKMFVLSGNENIIDGTWYYDFDRKVYYKGSVYAADSVIRKYFKSNLEN